jgi:methyl-accepting chemotaxis protein
MLWIRQSIIRMILAGMAIILTLCMGITVAASYAFQSKVEQLYDEMIFAGIVPNMQGLPQRIGAEEEKAIATGEAQISAAVVERAKGMGRQIGDDTWPADSFREHVSDRRARGGLDKLGSLFMFADDSGKTLILHQGVHSAEGVFQGVHTLQIAVPDANSALDQLTSFRAAESSKLDERRAKFADLALALGKVQVMVGKTIDDVNASRQAIRAVKLKWQVWGAVLLTALLAAGFASMAVLLRRQADIIVKLGKTMTEIKAACDDVAHLERIEIPGRDRVDETGVLAAGLVAARDAMLETQDLHVRHAEERARVQREKITSINVLAETVENETGSAVETVSDVLTRMTDTIGAMVGSATAVGENSRNAASNAASALSNAQTVAAAAEELSASISGIAGQVANASEVTGRAVVASNNAQETIKRLSSAVARIGEVANLISAIAAQTNLLALNATIEAARAGDAGKGFAVVAGEVKNLATQTAKATGEITTQIGAIQTNTAHAVHSVAEIDGAIAEVQAVSGAIALAIEQQGSATAEIARNILQTTLASQEVSQHIALVSDEARISHENAGRVNQLAADMVEGVDNMRQVLVRAVRSLMKEADRQKTVRYRFGRPAVLSLGPRNFDVTIENISEGGLMASGLPADVATGTRVKVTIPGIAAPFTVVVVAAENNRLHGQFELTPDALEEWRGECLRLSRELTPLRDVA